MAFRHARAAAFCAGQAAHSSHDAPNFGATQTEIFEIARKLLKDRRAFVMMAQYPELQGTLLENGHKWCIFEV